MNVTFGLIDDTGVPPTKDRAKRREEIVRRALESVALWRDAALGLPVAAGAGKGGSS